MRNLLLEQILIQIYTEVIKISRVNNQIVGEKRDYYVTLQQLEEIMLRYKK